MQRSNVALAVGECYGALGTEEVSLAEIIHSQLTQLEAARPCQDDRVSGQARQTALLKEQRRLVSKVWK